MRAIVALVLFAGFSGWGRAEVIETCTIQAEGRVECLPVEGPEVELEESDTEATFQMVSENLTKIENSFLQQHAGLTNDLKQVAAYHASLNAEIKKFRKTNSKQGCSWANLEGLITENQGVQDKINLPVFLNQISFVSSDGCRYDTDSKLLQTKVTASLSKFKNELPSKCFNLETKVFRRDLPHCLEKIKQCSEVGFGGMENNIYVEKIDLDGDWSRKEFQSFSDYSVAIQRSADREANPLYAVAKMDFLFCQLAAKSGEKYIPERISLFPNEDPAWASESGRAYDVESLKKSCLGQALSEERLKFLKLMAKSRNPFPLKIWLDRVDEQKKNCPVSVMRVCRRVNHIKGIATLAYSTANCKIRKVTASDVEADIRRSVQLDYWTDAERLEHSELLDELMVCDEAHKRGFEWIYVPPSVRKNCKPE